MIEINYKNEILYNGNIVGKINSNNHYCEIARESILCCNKIEELEEILNDTNEELEDMTSEKDDYIGDIDRLQNQIDMYEVFCSELDKDTKIIFDKNEKLLDIATDFMIHNLNCEFKYCDLDLIDYNNRTDIYKVDNVNRMKMQDMLIKEFSCKIGDSVLIIF